MFKKSSFNLKHIHRLNLRNIYILIQVFIWLVIFLVISPWPFGVIKVELASLSQNQLFIFFIYELIVKVIMVYTYAHLALPGYLDKRRPTYFFQVNFIYLLLFSSFEGAINQLYISTLDGNIFDGYLDGFINLSIIHLFINLFLMIYANLNGFAFAWFRDEQTRRNLEKAKLSAELSSLKQQIHPHFLFNTLNSLYGLAYINDDEATAEGIAKLSRMMRYMIYETKDEMVSLLREIAYIEDYIDLQKLRIHEGAKVQFELKGDPSPVMIAPMIFIPFIENAFKYGISALKDSRILIKLGIFHDKLVFEIENPVFGRSEEGEKQLFGGIGQMNVKKRLKLIYKNAHDLAIESGSERYYVRLMIKL